MSFGKLKAEDEKCAEAEKATSKIEPLMSFPSDLSSRSLVCISVLARAAEDENSFRLRKTDFLHDLVEKMFGDLDFCGQLAEML
jgi:hypothetical protein